MDSSSAQADLVSLIAGEIDTATLAARHGVTEEEALRWRAIFLAGMKASVGGQAMGLRRRRHRMIVLAGTVLATAAFAQLTVFNADQPALASQVNGNFNQLKTWLEQKVGTVGTNAISTGTVSATSVSATSVSATTVTASGRVIGNALAPAYADWTTGVSGLTGGAGIVNDNVGYRALMVVGNNSAGSNRKIQLYDDVSVSNDLVVGNNSWGTAADLPTVKFTANQGGAMTFSVCPQGRFVCAIGLGHDTGDSQYWTGAKMVLTCCAL